MVVCFYNDLGAKLCHGWVIIVYSLYTFIQIKEAVGSLQGGV